MATSSRSSSRSSGRAGAPRDSVPRPPRAARARAVADGDDRTRERILEAAGAVFAAHGYRDGTVRDICRRAKANVSAVAYHFDSKAGLYEAVLRRAHAYAAERYPVTGLAALAASGGRAGAEEALRRFVATLLRRLLDRGRPAWHGHLMMREMAQPTAAFHILSDEMAGPLFAEAAGIVSALIGEDTGSERTRLGVASVIGQCTVHRNAKAVLSALRPSASLDIDLLTDHVTAFSLAGLQARPAAAPAPRRGRTP